jgi:choline monooxygenase
MPRSLDEIVNAYDLARPLERASTVPAGWYTDPRVLELEGRTVFRHAWQYAARLSEFRETGDYVSCELAGGEPALLACGPDHRLRAFFNVCRHHAAAVAPDGCGSVRVFKCPYHGWTYSLDGRLVGTPDFSGVCDFDRSNSGLVPMACEAWEQWAFVRPGAGGPPLHETLGSGLVRQVQSLDLGRLQWVERRRYSLACNWKVYVDNYLDGGYHVPHLHRGLDSVLSYADYTIETGKRFCLQSSPLVAEGADPGTAAVRHGARAFYYWIYPNLMLNCYGSAADTNLVIPRGVDRTEVIFDFYFDDVSADTSARRAASIAVSEQIQDEDVAICESVQRGLRSGAYESGRLSVRREAGEHLFHQLLFDDLKTGLV